MEVSGGDEQPLDYYNSRSIVNRSPFYALAFVEYEAPPQWIPHIADKRNLNRLDHYVLAYKKIFLDVGGVYLSQTTEAMDDGLADERLLR